MEIEKAEAIAEMIGGAVVEAEKGNWIVLLERADGRIITLSDTTIDEYPDREAVEVGRCYASIRLA